MSLRNKIRSFVYFKIGNGKSYNFWFDKWHNMGPLCDLVNYEVMRNARFNFKQKDVVLIRDNNWKWPRHWIDRFGEVLDILVPNINACIEDKAIWINEKIKEKKFVVKEVWKVLRPNAPKVIWCNHV